MNGWMNGFNAVIHIVNLRGVEHPARLIGACIQCGFKGSFLGESISIRSLLLPYQVWTHTQDIITHTLILARLRIHRYHFHYTYTHNTGKTYTHTHMQHTNGLNRVALGASDESSWLISRLQNDVPIVVTITSGDPNEVVTLFHSWIWVLLCTIGSVHSTYNTMHCIIKLYWFCKLSKRLCNI